MKLKSQLMLRNIAGNYMVVPVGERTQDVPGVIALNETGAFLWKLLEQDTTKETLLHALTAEYEVDEAEAQKDLQTFLADLQEKGWLDA
ncbi:MAG: PqqD family protein [Oscillospiraceae bacterium]|jgi:hypothetical protein|nr:PqqD family protein [Oscillospiraceae bacterium]MDD3260368.1 PqqD family protein [Oscillospiraceae bacterium]